MLLVVLLLAVGAAGTWYYKKHHAVTSTPGVALNSADVTLAEHTGIASTDLSGWKAISGSPGNPFAVGASQSPVATVTQASTTPCGIRGSGCAWLCSL